MSCAHMPCAGMPCPLVPQRLAGQDAHWLSATVFPSRAQLGTPASIQPHASTKQLSACATATCHTETALACSFSSSSSITLAAASGRCSFRGSSRSRNLEKWNEIQVWGVWGEPLRVRAHIICGLA